MIVELKERTSRNLATGRMIKLESYRVLVDGRHAGYIGWKPGSPLCLTEKFGPIETKKIESEVASLLEREHVNSSQPPEVPEELMEPPEEEIILDDFDTSPIVGAGEARDETDES